MASTAPEPTPSGRVDRLRTPSRRAIRARARPWLPSVAVTSVTAEPATRGRSSSREPAGRAYPARALNARLTAHEAPRILNAGSPNRSASSFSHSCATPSWAASPGRPTSGVGR